MISYIRKPKNPNPQPPLPTTATPPPTTYFSTLPHSKIITTERHRINHYYGLDCTIRSRPSRGQGHRIQHPQLYRLCTGGLLSGDLLRALLDIQGSTTPAIYTGHLDNWVRDPQTIKHAIPSPTATTLPSPHVPPPPPQP